MYHLLTKKAHIIRHYIISLATLACIRVIYVTNITFTNRIIASQTIIV